MMRGSRSLSDICDNADDDVVSTLAAAYCDNTMVRRGLSGNWAKVRLRLRL